MKRFLCYRRAKMGSVSFNADCELVIRQMGFEETYSSMKSLSQSLNSEFDVTSNMEQCANLLKLHRTLDEMARDGGEKRLSLH